MKVLHLSGTKIQGRLSPIIKSQTDSIADQGIDVFNYSVNGKGINGYFKEIIPLKKHLKNNEYDLIHAHFSYAGFLAALCSRLPIIVSLMGAEVYEKLYWLPFIKLFSLFRWNATIVKSIKMYNKLKVDKANVIPNGVDLKKFIIMDKVGAIKKVKFSSKRQILFFSPNRYEKNYKLACKAFKELDDKSVELNSISNVNHDFVCHLLNAADVLLLTSLFEGSPNIIKEAMACNLPIVSVDVGDVREIIEGTKGCFVTNNSSKDISRKLSMALTYNKKTKGRKIIEEKLDQKIISKKIINLYKNIIKESQI